MSKHEKRRYVNARERAEKEKQGFTANILKLPEGAELFKPKAGRYLLDILPYVKEDGTLDYERRFWTHRNVGANEQTFICPLKTFRKPCPICEAQAKLTRRGADEDLIKSLAPKERQLFNIRDRKQPDKGVMVFEFSYHLFGKQLTDAVLSADEEDNWDLFFTLEDGQTLKVTFADQSRAGYNFVGAERIDFRPRDPLKDSTLDQVYNLDEMLIEPDYDTLKKAFLETSSEDEDDEEDQDDEPKSKRSRAKDDDDDSEKEETEDEEDEEPKAKKKAPKDEDDDWDEFESKKKSKKDKDDEEDEEEDDSEEEEDERPAKKSRKARDEEEDEEEEEEEEEEEPKSKKKSKDDDEDDDWEEVEQKSKKKSKKDDDEDEEEENDEEEDDEPKSKKGGLFPRGKHGVRAGSKDDEDED